MTTLNINACRSEIEGQFAEKYAAGSTVKFELFSRLDAATAQEYLEELSSGIEQVSFAGPSNEDDASETITVKTRFFVTDGYGGKIVWAEEK